MELVILFSDSVSSPESLVCSYCEMSFLTHQGRAGLRSAVELTRGSPLPCGHPDHLGRAPWEVGLSAGRRPVAGP